MILTAKKLTPSRAVNHYTLWFNLWLFHFYTESGFDMPLLYCKHKSFQIYFDWCW